MEELQVSFKDLYPEAHQPKVEKTKIVVLGDSMMKNVNGRDVSRCVSFKIRPKPVALTEDLTDHIIPTIRKKTRYSGNSYRYYNDLQNIATS